MIHKEVCENFFYNCSSIYYLAVVLLRMFRLKGLWICISLFWSDLVCDVKTKIQLHLDLFSHIPGLVHDLLYLKRDLWAWWWCSYLRRAGSSGLWHALICHAGLTHIIHWGLFAEEFPGSAWRTVKADMQNSHLFINPKGPQIHSAHKLMWIFTLTWPVSGFKVMEVVPSWKSYTFKISMERH